jgi:hypothetical protein
MLRPVLLALLLTLAACSSDPNSVEPGSRFPTAWDSADQSDPLACGCALPAFTDLECQAGIVGAAGECALHPVNDGAPCRSGAGRCVAGACEGGPTWSPMPLDPCLSAADCDDGDPCTLDLCPMPGCDTCYHRAAEDDACATDRDS